MLCQLNLIVQCGAVVIFIYNCSQKALTISQKKVEPVASVQGRPHSDRIIAHNVTGNPVKFTGFTKVTWHKERAIQGVFYATIFYVCFVSMECTHLNALYIYIKVW